MTDAPRTADQLTDAELHAAGFRDPARARRLFVGLAGRGVTDDDVALILPALLSALSECPDPDRSLANFARWFDALTNKATYFRYLAAHPTGLRILVHIGATSQFLADILAREPEYAEIIANPGVRGGVKAADQMFREMETLVGRITHLELKLDALRRYRQREVLRIAARDLLGLAELTATTQEFSNLADASVQVCLALAAQVVQERHPNLPNARLAVIALGKLGGMELNYSSDIDLIFVADGCSDGGDHDQALEAATRQAEYLLAYLSRDTRSGHLFRVDARLRPEGRSGALVRTLASYRSYYENWAETWEKQAMVKARFVAGDHRLGQEFLDMIAAFAYPRSLSAGMLRDIRTNKQRMETRLRRAEDPRSNVKIGLGGIRDVEFTVQLLQMLHGARDPLVRTPNTLDAIARLRHAGLLSPSDADALADGYIFLRTVEHRLQLLYDRQTQDLPRGDLALDLLGRRMGFPDGEAFRQRYNAVTDRVRQVHERVFYGEEPETRPAESEWTAELMALASHPDEEGTAENDAAVVLVDHLQSQGFVDAEGMVQSLRASLAGTGHGREAPEAVAEFLRLAPHLLQECARSPDPDAAWSGMALLADSIPNRAQWYQALLQAPELLRRLVRLAAGSRSLIQMLVRHPEWLDLMVSDEILATELKPRAAFEEELDARVAPLYESLEASRVPSGEMPDTYWQVLAGYCKRERLRIGARDIWGETSAAAAALELSHLADATLHILLRAALACVFGAGSPEADKAAERFAVMGLGKLGGQELSFFSDYDLVFVCTDDCFTAPSSGGKSLYESLTHVAEWLLNAVPKIRAHGVPFALDIRLRPEGRFGPTVQSTGQFRAYFADRAEVWERQTLIKARYVAGAQDVAQEFLSLTRDFVYGKELQPEEADAVRAMKARIENERLRPDEKALDLKLGHGGLSDIEFLTQIWQLKLGCRYPEVRSVRTLDALDALAEVGALPGPDVARLTSNYRFLLRLRNRLALLAGQSMDSLPQDRRRMRALAIGFGMVDAGGRRAEDKFRVQVAERMAETRRIFERWFGERSLRGASR